jgi:GTPase SAR1 family protein
MKDILEGPGMPSFRMKMMILGKHGKGKSTLLRGLTKTKAKTKDPKDSVESVSVDEWQVQLTLETKEVKQKQQVNISVWDFTGSDAYYTR